MPPKVDTKAGEAGGSAQDAENVEDAGNGEISKINVKLPPFWTAQPELWFQQVEAQFHINGIRRDTSKYFTVISAVESRVLTHVSDIVRDPPVTGKYETLKRRIIEQFTDSETKKIKKLLSEIELGDKKPSQLLLEMKDLAGEAVTDEFMKSLFIQRMPSTVRPVLSISTDDLQAIAKMADKMLEASSDSHVMAVSGTSKMTEFEKKLNMLINKIDEIQVQQRSRSRSKSRDHHSRRAVSGGRSGQRKTFDTCWYHFKFKDRANKCNQPCNYKKAEN